MSRLLILVDYDNVETSLTTAGPMSLARLLISLLPTGMVSQYARVVVRLYGGWRSKGALTTSAQRIIPDIRQGSPTAITTTHNGAVVRQTLVVELADSPIGLTIPLDETLVKERDLRKFRAKKSGSPNCANPSSCGMGHFSGMTHATACTHTSCSSRLGDVFVRDEQKMVDTLIVADIAQTVLVDKAKDIVVISSDTDMWPGILLAVRAGCAVTHLHTKTGWKTQGHLMRTLGSPASPFYSQLST